ncbi:TetR family transcriptional regulator [Methylophaga lonarensis MPL]|uniref:TetR family transcriptional regulator n=1 Tax=Methylophaga lonarensis MPL TaxID=1286106 RepID=M7PI57_9GAMM|nr:TetR/AcrR family transcriptional regulator [Methylophaga lonarensis]EMR13585.1 TetR family transcriptional regulator [Methylophaga lonarensis MPL]
MILNKSQVIQDKREAILDAALDLLASCGFHGFSIKQLADKAGVAAGTVYLYFTDREDLIRQLHSEIVQTVAEAIFADNEPSADLWDQYQLICHNLWLFYLENPRVLLAKAQFDHLPPATLRSEIEQAWNLFKPLSDLYDKGRSQGTIKPLSNHILFGLSIGSLVFIARHRLLGFDDIDSEQFEFVIKASWDAISTQTTANFE